MINDDLDKTDIQILQSVQGNANLSLGQLAEQLNMSKSACWRRVQKMEDNGVIQQRVTILDPEQLGLDLTCFIFVKTNQHNREWSQLFRKTVADITEVIEVYRMSGDVDYLIKAIVKDMKDYDRLYQLLIQAELFDVSAGFVMETMKHSHALPLDSITL